MCKKQTLGSPRDIVNPPALYKMTSKFKFIALMLLSAGMGLYWYPLAKLESLQIESAQLLFFAFSSASILTVPFMAREANTWRKKTFELLIYALTGGASTVLLQFAFLQGSSTVVVALFCMAVLVVFFFNSMLSKQSFAISDFLLFLTLMLSASLLLLIANGLAVVQWWQLFAVLSGVGASRLLGVGEEDGSSIPVMTRVASIFLVSTWLVGMVLIFSPLSASFPKEHSTLFSFLYGAIVLVPIVAATVMIFQQHALLLPSH